MDKPKPICLSNIQAFFVVTTTLVNIYILIVAALDETIIPSCLHFSMQNIEQSRGLCRASGWNNVNVNQYLSLFINICVTSFTYRHNVMYRTFVPWLFQHLRYK